MLLEFRIENFKSFRKNNYLSMIASTQRDHNESLIRVEKKAKRVLPVAVIFGANASGKSNFLSAMSILKELVLNGDLYKCRVFDNLKASTFRFLYDGNSEPVKCGITFMKENRIFDYDLKVGFDEAGEGAYIAFEELSINNKQVFIRNGQKITTNKLVSDKEALISHLEEQKKFVFLFKDLNDESVDGLKKSELFLTSYFKILFSRETVDTIQEWFAKDICFYSETDNDVNSLSMPYDVATTNYILNKFMKLADMGNQEIFYISNKDTENDNSVLVSRYRSGNGKVISIKSEDIESRGTMHLFKFLGPFIDALKNGKTLIVDELDTSLHPFVLAKIIRIFMNPELNKHGSQIIFTSHSAILLDKSLMRRDSLVFVERDSENYESNLYTLADFKTSGSLNVRNDESYLKNYLSGKYGALPNIELSEAVREILKSSETDSLDSSI